MSMTRSALKTDLGAMLGDAAKKFDTDLSAYDRHLNIAALALARKTRRTSVVKLSLQSDVSDYAAPSDLIEVKFSAWGENYKAKPWQSKIGKLPRPTAYVNQDAMYIRLSPAPDACQISELGADYPLFYYSSYTISDDPGATNVPVQYRDLLLIRAVVQALMELANSGSTKPVSLGAQGVGNMPKNGTPAALAESWLALFDGGR